MSLARYAAKLAAMLNSSGQVPASALQDGAVTAAKIAAGAIPPSNDASALTTGTLPIARIADGALAAAKLAAGAAAANLGFTPYTQAQVDAALAGKQASLGFTPANAASFAVSISSSGYQKLPGGLIIQWGWRPNGGVGFFWQTFPMAFPNACFGLTTNVVRSSAMGDYRGWYGANTSGAYIATDQGDAFYIAVGY